MTSYVPQKKICCLGEGEQPRHTSTRSYCPVCFRPVNYKVVDQWLYVLGAGRDRRWLHKVEMVMRHRSDGVSSGTRLGIPNRKVTTQ